MKYFLSFLLISIIGLFVFAQIEVENKMQIVQNKIDSLEYKVNQIESYNKDSIIIFFYKP